MDDKKLANILSILMKNASEIFDGLEGFKNGKLVVEADGEKEHLVIEITKGKSIGLDMKISLRPLQPSQTPTETKSEKPEEITPAQVIEQTEELAKSVSESAEEEAEGKEEEVFFL